MATHNDRVLLPVTAVIDCNEQENAAMRWSFEAAITHESNKNLSNLILRIGEGFGIADHCSQLEITKFAVTVSMKDFKATADCPEGRIFEIDSQEQWNAGFSIRAGSRRNSPAISCELAAYFNRNYPKCYE